MIDLFAVDALLAIARTGTVHAASAELGFTPSAVSQQIKRLERDLGARLLDRAGRGVVLTAAGRRVVDEGALLREQVESLRSRLHDAQARPTGTIRLGAFATAVRGIVPGLVLRVRDQHPDLRVTVQELDPWNAVDAVAAGTLDVAIVHHWEGVGLALPPSLRSEELFRDVADVLLPADDPLAGATAVTPADIRDRTWASTPDGTICYEWFCHMFRGEPSPPRIDYWCLEFASQGELVAAGVAVALVPRLGRGRLPDGVVAVPVHDPVPTRPVTLVWRATMTEAPAIRALRELLDAR
ncbi:MAG: LysR family transcriptional regulator [Microbacterium sp.]|uniref:LysR family transcriptional regulator n=1 Tax=Microbacterium sp. TaxID=51671 RepID=UPI0026153A29|nr:LysR family transcriptional regulator [Microbacterium sp.]MCX6502514.1 LysR family transcriptional regulator [Microbacterium sp.]